MVGQRCLVIAMKIKHESIKRKAALVEAKCLMARALEESAAIAATDRKPKAFTAGVEKALVNLIAASYADAVKKNIALEDRITKLEAGLAAEIKARRNGDKT